MASEFQVRAVLVPDRDKGLVRGRIISSLRLPAAIGAEHVVDELECGKTCQRRQNIGVRGSCEDTWAAYVRRTSGGRIYLARHFHLENKT